MGLWSLAHLHAVSYLAALRQLPGVELVGLADEDPQRGRTFAQAHGLRYWDDPAGLLDHVDGIVITSANVDHCSMALTAAQHGVHALVEKPIATRLEDAQAMIDAYRRSDLILGTAFPCPFSPAFEELLRAVRSGDLGSVLAVKATNQGSMPGGFFIQTDRSGGGAVIDHTVHVVDLLRRLSGAEIQRVQAEIGHGLYHQPWDDSGFLTMDLSDGSFATLDSSWSRPNSFPTWGNVTLHVVGERGNASVDLFVQHVTLYPAEPTKPSWQSWASDLDGLLLADFVSAIRNHRAPRATGLDGLAATAVALAAYRSARENGPVTVDMSNTPMQWP